MFILLMFIAFCFWVVLSWRKIYCDPKAPPVHPGGLPIIGNAHQLLGDSIQLWRALTEMSYFSLKSGGVSTVYFGWWSRVYFVTDPDDYLTLSNACIDKPFIYDVVKEWSKNGLLAADVSIWKPHRKLLNPMFSHHILYENLKIFNSQARRLANKMSVELNKGKFDPHEYIKAISIETICLIILGVKRENLKHVVQDYIQAAQALLDVFIVRNQKLWLHFSFFFNRSTNKKTLQKCIKTTSTFITEAIKNRRAELKLDSNVAGETVSLLDRMLKLEESSFTDEDIKDHLEILILAGFDSITDTLTFALKLIGSHKSVQQKIYEELQDVLGAADVDVTRHDIPRLIYLDAVIKETLRMYSAVPFSGRSILKEVKLKNYTLPAGSIAGLSSIGVHRHPMWGPDAEQFRPERWLEPTSPINVNPSLFAAFSLGKRNCIGKYYALLFLKTTIAHLLRQYCIEADDTEMTVKFDVSIRPVAGHEITLKRR